MTQKASNFYAQDRRSFSISALLFAGVLIFYLAMHQSACKRQDTKTKVLRTLSLFLLVIASLYLAYMSIIFLYPGDMDPKSEALYTEISDLDKEIQQVGRGRSQN